VSVGRKERHVGLNQTLTVECHVDARPPASLSWKHNGTDVIGRVNVIVGASVDYCDVAVVKTWNFSLLKDSPIVVSRASGWELLLSRQQEVVHPLGAGGARTPTVSGWVMGIAEIRREI